MIKLLIAGFLALGIALGVLIKAGVMIRRGERYRFGPFDGGALLSGRSTSPWNVVMAALVYLAGCALLLAWPLGIYDYFAESRSACRNVITDAELRRIGGPSFEPLTIQEFGSACSARSHDTHNDRFELTIDGFGGSWAGRGVALELPSGQPARLQRVPGAVLLRLEQPRAAIELTLPERAFDDEEVQAIARLADERRALTEPYATLAGGTPSPLARLVRRVGPLVCPALIGVALLLAGVWIARSRSRAARSGDDAD